jgi:ribose 5-phosphate isomerase A
MSVAKRVVGEAAALEIQSGMLVGLGTGSTAACFLEALGRRIKEENLQGIRGVATSRASELLAQQYGIPLVPMDASQEIAMEIDITVDGADEIDPNLNLIKGAGGALVREKIVASRSKQMLVIADSSKIVPILGKFPLSIAVFPFGHTTTKAKLESVLGVSVVLRLAKESNIPYLTDDGLYVLDIQAGSIPNPAEYEAYLKTIPGVAETGLFCGIATRVLIGHEDGKVTVTLT